jgi:hypothetical protein
VDDVYLDGRKLPRSALATSNITLSALLDTVRPLPDPLDTIHSVFKRREIHSSGAPETFWTQLWSNLEATLMTVQKHTLLLSKLAGTCIQSIHVISALKLSKIQFLCAPQTLLRRIPQAQVFYIAGVSVTRFLNRERGCRSHECYPPLSAVSSLRSTTAI